MSICLDGSQPQHGFCKEKLRYGIKYAMHFNEIDTWVQKYNPNTDPSAYSGNYSFTQGGILPPTVSYWTIEPERKGSKKKGDVINHGDYVNIIYWDNDGSSPTPSNLAIAQDVMVQLGIPMTSFVHLDSVGGGLQILSAIGDSVEVGTPVHIVPHDATSPSVKNGVGGLGWGVYYRGGHTILLSSSAPSQPPSFYKLDEGLKPARPVECIPGHGCPSGQTCVKNKCVSDPSPTPDPSPSPSPKPSPSPTPTPSKKTSNIAIFILVLLGLLVLFVFLGKSKKRTKTPISRLLQE